MAQLVKQVIKLPLTSVPKVVDSWDEWYNKESFTGYYCPPYSRLVRTKETGNAKFT